MNLESKHDLKEKIRLRYKGGDVENMHMIPARIKESLFDENTEKKVCAYCRVSTDDPRQTSSYELQKNHYEEFIKEHPGWVLVDIYADEGITGTSLDKRDEFNRMIADCQRGRIELILCKSVARFARNVVDSIQTVRMLQNLKPPVGVFFETEHISTLDSTSEMMLALLSMTAQEESHNKSEIMNVSIEQRFRRGVLLTPPLLGYDWDANHRLTINAGEAATVRLAYAMLLAGFSKKQIAAKLNELGRPSKLGNISWNAGSVTGLLRNERYCGDVLARKTFTPNYLNHRPRKNRQDRNQYLWRSQHEPIVSPHAWHAAQTILNICKNGGSGSLPALQVIREGALQGFVSVNRHQHWEDPDAFVRASLSAYGDELSEEDVAEEAPIAAEVTTSGFQVVRAGFFQDKYPAMTLSRKYMHFNSLCFRRLGEPVYVEVLLNPVERLLAIRPCPPQHPNALRWVQTDQEKTGTRHLGAAAFTGLVMDLMGWNSEHRYRIRGYVRRHDETAAMFFDLYEPEVHIQLAGEGREVKKLKGFPAEWAGQFGLSTFDQFNSARLPDEDLQGLDAPGHLVDLHELLLYTHDDVAAIVQEITETVDASIPTVVSDHSKEVR